MAEAFKAMIMTLGMLVAALMVLEGAAWLLHFTGTAKGSPVTLRPAQFSTLLHTPQHIAHSRSVLI